MSNLFERAKNDGIITISENNSRITYNIINKTRNYTDPEEKVQAETYLKLIYIYRYPKENIDMFVKVTMGTSVKEADIIVYRDKEHTKPYIIVECKREDISEKEFRQAVEQAFSYANSLAGTTKYVWITSKTKDEYYLYDKESNQQEPVTTIPYFGNEKTTNFKYAKGGRIGYEDPGDNKTKQQYFDLEKISESDLTRIFNKAHQALWAGGQLNPSEAFDELDKLIFCKIWDERKPRKDGDPYDFQIIIENNSDEKLSKEDKEEEITKKLYNRILKIYEEGRQKDKEVFRDSIRLTPQRVRTVVYYLQGIDLNHTDLDSKGRAFEAFMGSYFRGDFGQFFTPRNVVKFIVNCLPINNESKVLDSSCGSGGFLLYALDKVRTLADDYYDKNNINQNSDHFKFWHNFAEQNLFGIEINEQIARSAKMNMIIHDDGHTNVITSDGLLKSEKIIENTGNKGFEYGTFDFVITNPPFGSIIKQTESAYLHQYNFGNKDIDWLDKENSAVKNRDSQSTEVLFIEQDYNFLKEGGFLAIVIPDGILTNSTMQYVRDQIMTWYRIVAVVSLPQTAFTANGAGVKSSVMFLRKWSKTKQNEISNIIDSLKKNIKEEFHYKETVEKYEKEKKNIIKQHIGFDNKTGFTSIKDIEATDDFKEWKKQITEQYNQKISDLKEKLNDILLERKQTQILNYQIFMAIAEQIGYDATGKTIPQNDLETIGPKLEQFINNIIDDEFFFLENDNFCIENKIFLVNACDVIGSRVDPYYYQPIFYNLDNKIKNIGYEYLKKIAYPIKNGSTPTNGNFERQGVVYYRSQDFDLYDLHSKQFITYEFDAFLSRSHVMIGDILLAVVGATLGKIGLVCYKNQEGNINQNVARIRIKSSDYLSEFIAIYLNSNIGQMYINRLATITAQAYINNEQLSNIPIPTIPIIKQQYIIDLFRTSFTTRQTKLQEAKAKLASIDDYLLKELGITLPNQNYSELNDRMLFVDAKEVVGNRFDPKYNLRIGSILSLESYYPFIQLRELLSSRQGQYGANEEAKDWTENATRYIRITDIDENGELKKDNRKTANNIDNKYLLKYNDILFARSGSVGKCYIHKDITNKAIFAGYLIRFSIDNSKVDSDYLFYFCNSILYWQWIEAIQRPAVQSNINAEEFKSLLIPLPPLTKQKEIVSTISQIRAEAKKLEQEGNEILEQAKKKVEEMILEG